MGWKEKLGYARYLKNPDKIPSALKRAVKNHPLKQAVDFTVLNTVLERVDYAPFTTVMQKCVDGKGLNRLDRKSLRNLVIILQKGSGYDVETKRSIDKDIPELFERFCNKEQTGEDIQEMLDVQKFVRWLMDSEKSRIMIKKGFV